MQALGLNYTHVHGLVKWAHYYNFYTNQVESILNKLLRFVLYKGRQQMSFSNHEHVSAMVEYKLESIQLQHLYQEHVYIFKNLKD